jgi:HTH domain
VTASDEAICDTDWDYDSATSIDGELREVAHTVAENVARFKGLIADARDGRVRKTLGWSSWTTYIADVISKEMGRLDVDTRRDLVALLAGEGMSGRAIADAVGVSNATVSRDLDAIEAEQVLHDVTPESPSTVIGRDGKTYPAQPKPKPTPVNTMVADDLHRLLFNGLLMASKDETIPTICKVCLEFGTDQVISVGTDKYVLGVTRADYEGEPMMVQLRRADADKLARIAKTTERPVWPSSDVRSVQIDRTDDVGKFTFSTGEAITVDDQTDYFPNWQPLIPSEPIIPEGRHVTVDPAKLATFTKVIGGGPAQMTMTLQGWDRPVLITIGDSFVGALTGAPSVCR